MTYQRTIVLFLLFVLFFCEPIRGFQQQPSLEKDGGLKITLGPTSELNVETKPLVQRELEVRLKSLRIPFESIDPVENGFVLCLPGMSKKHFEEKQEAFTRRGMLEFLIVACKEQHAELIEFALAQHGDVKSRTNREVLDKTRKVIGKWVKLGDDVAGLHCESTNIGNSHYIREATTGEIYGVDRAEITDIEGPLSEWKRINRVDELEILVEITEIAGATFNSEHLKFVKAGIDQRGLPNVVFETTEEGGKLLGDLTTRHLPVDGKQFNLGIIFDDRLMTAPRISSVITREGMISGNFTQAETDEMVQLLKLGALSTEFKVVAIEEVQPNK